MTGMPPLPPGRVKMSWIHSGACRREVIGCLQPFSTIIVSITKYNDNVISKFVTRSLGRHSQQYLRVLHTASSMNQTLVPQVEVENLVIRVSLFIILRPCTA